jgi:hypothetical protein
MSKVDELVDRGADRLQQAAERTAAQRGYRAKVSEELADGAAFVRKLKPSLMVARAKGEAPTNQKPGEGVVMPLASTSEQPTKAGRRGLSPWVIVGAALAVGILAAKIIDWRGYAHPRY